MLTVICLLEKWTKTKLQLSKRVCGRCKLAMLFLSFLTKHSKKLLNWRLVVRVKNKIAWADVNQSGFRLLFFSITNWLIVLYAWSHTCYAFKQIKKFLTCQKINRKQMGSLEIILITSAWASYFSSFLPESNFQLIVDLVASLICVLILVRLKQYGLFLESPSNKRFLNFKFFEEDKRLLADRDGNSIHFTL